MKRILLALSLTTVFLSANAQAAWEYQVKALRLAGLANPSADLVQQTLNESSKSGWELVEAVYDPQGSRLMLILKRRIGG